MDLRKISTLIAYDYTDNNQPVSTSLDAVEHQAGKSLFCKLDCSQAYHCLQMADQRSVEMLAFNFASTAFVYKRLAQGLRRSVSAFSSFMHEYLDPVVKADQCAQYMNGKLLLKNWTILFSPLEQHIKSKLSSDCYSFGPQDDWTKKFLLSTSCRNLAEDLIYVRQI